MIVVPTFHIPQRCAVQSFIHCHLTVGFMKRVLGTWLTVDGHLSPHSQVPITACCLGWCDISLQVLTSISICFQISGRNIVNEDIPKLLAGPEASINDRQMEER